MLKISVNVGECTTAADVKAVVERALNDAGYFVVSTKKEAKRFFATYAGVAGYVYDNVCAETRVTIADQYGEFCVLVLITELYTDPGSVDYCYLVEAKEL